MCWGAVEANDLKMAWKAHLEKHSKQDKAKPLNKKTMVRIVHTGVSHCM